MECIPGGGLGFSLCGCRASSLGPMVFSVAAKEMAAPRRAAASSADEGGAWGFSLVMVRLMIPLLDEDDRKQEHGEHGARGSRCRFIK